MHAVIVIVHPQQERAHRREETDESAREATCSAQAGRQTGVDEHTECQENSGDERECFISLPG